MKKIFYTVMLVCGLMLFAFSEGEAGDLYTIDQSHSTIGFAVKHLGVSTTRGQFDDYEGSFVYDAADLSNFSGAATIQAASINTNNDNRDEHLRTADFFDVAQYPIITFDAEALIKNDDGHQIAGVLNIKGVEQRIYIPVEIAGPIDNPRGGKVIGIKGETVIDRKDFNITWDKKMDNGGLVVGDKVTLIVELEGHAE